MQQDEDEELDSESPGSMQGEGSDLLPQARTVGQILEDGDPEGVEYHYKEYTPVTVHCPELECTRSDLSLIDNSLAVINSILPTVYTVKSFCALNREMCRLIATRRKVLKMPWGESRDRVVARGEGYEVLD